MFAFKLGTVAAAPAYFPVVRASVHVRTPASSAAKLCGKHRHRCPFAAGVSIYLGMSQLVDVGKYNRSFTIQQPNIYPAAVVISSRGYCNGPKEVPLFFDRKTRHRRVSYRRFDSPVNRQALIKETFRSVEQPRRRLCDHDDHESVTDKSRELFARLVRRTNILRVNLPTSVSYIPLGEYFSGKNDYFKFTGDSRHWNGERDLWRREVREGLYKHECNLLY